MGVFAKCSLAMLRGTEFEAATGKQEKLEPCPLSVQNDTVFLAIFALKGTCVNIPILNKP